MEELKQTIMDAVAASNGAVSYREVWESLGFRSQRMLPDALRSLESDQLAHRYVEFIPGEGTLFEIRAGVHPRFAGQS